MGYRQNQVRLHLRGLAHFSYKRIMFYKSFIRKVRSHLEELARLTGSVYLHINSPLLGKKLWMKGKIFYVTKLQPSTSDEKKYCNQWDQKIYFRGNIETGGNSDGSSRSEAFYKKCVLKNCEKFTGKHLCYS